MNVADINDSREEAKSSSTASTLASNNILIKHADGDEKTVKSMEYGKSKNQTNVFKAC